MPLSNEDAHGATTYTIRTARPSDLERLRHVYREASFANVAGRDALRARPDLRLLSDDAVRHERCRVAVGLDQRVLGFSSYLEVGDAVELEDLFVAPVAWRQGLGRALVRDVVALARENRRTTLMVTANPDALAFYEKMGFTYNHDVTTELGPAVRLSFNLR